MSEYFHVEKPFLDQLAMLGGMVIDQGHGRVMKLRAVEDQSASIPKERTSKLGGSR